MSTLASDLINKSREPNVGSGEFAAELENDPNNSALPSYDASRDRTSQSSSEAILRGSKQITLADKAIQDRVSEADNSHLPSGDGEVDSQLREIMTARNPESEDHYLHAAYFAQTGGRSGFSYLLHTQSGVTPITFAEGIFVTTSVAIVDQLRSDIKRSPNVSTQIKEVTAQQYRQLLEAAQASKSLLSRSGGLANSTDVASDAQEIMAAQKRQIAELQAKLDAKDAAAGVPANKRPSFGAGKTE